MAKYFWPRGHWSVVNVGFVNMRPADGWAIHHTAAPNAPTGLDVGRLRALEAGEIRTGQYSALAYHRYIAEDGGVAEVRPWLKQGGATGGHNSHTYAIVMDGYFHPPHNESPTPDHYDAAADEIVWAVLAGVATPGSVNAIKPHREWTAGTRYATVCPGDGGPQVKDEGPYGWFSIQARVRSKLAGAADVGATPPSSPAAPPRCVAVSSRRTLRKGDSGVTVRTLQNLLRSKGFDPGITDGKFGDRTDAAVRCFQTQSHLTADGIVGPVTWAALTA